MLLTSPDSWMSLSYDMSLSGNWQNSASLLTAKFMLENWPTTFDHSGLFLASDSTCCHSTSRWDSFWSSLHLRYFGKRFKKMHFSSSTSTIEIYSLYSQLLFLFEITYAFIEQSVIHFHEQLQCVVYQSMYRLVPMCYWIPVQWWHHDRKYNLRIFLYQRHNILVVPIVQCSFGHLEMWTGHALRYLSEQKFHDFLKFSRLYDVQNLFQFVQKHHFFGTVRFRPKFQQTLDDRFG